MRRFVFLSLTLAVIISAGQTYAHAYSLTSGSGKVSTVFPSLQTIVSTTTQSVTQIVDTTTNAESAFPSDSSDSVDLGSSDDSDGTVTLSATPILTVTTNTIVSAFDSAERILQPSSASSGETTISAVPTQTTEETWGKYEENNQTVTPAELQAVGEAVRTFERSSQKIRNAAPAIESIQPIRREEKETPLTTLRLASEAREQATVKTVIERRDEVSGVLAIYRDSDRDGISDFDEMRIFHTDPNNSHTAGGALNDGERVLLGLDTINAIPKPVPVESPLSAGVFVDGVFEVTSISLTTTVTPGRVVGPDLISPAEKHENIIFSGRTLPNGFITLYIFSTPIVVTVKADSEGRWSYVLDKQIEDGSHQLYVAMVNNEGRIIAKSNPIPFVKTAEAVEYAPLILPASVGGGPGDWQNSFVMMGVFFFALFALFGLIVVGAWRFQKHAVGL